MGRLLYPIVRQILAEAAVLEGVGSHLPSQLAGNFKVYEPTLVYAPPKSRQGNSWLHGDVHRDFIHRNAGGIFSFMIFLDDVSGENGAIEFWPNSISVPLPSRPTPALRRITASGLSSTLLTGPEGTVSVWDAREVHRSIRNDTEGSRRTMFFFVTTEDAAELNIRTFARGPALQVLPRPRR
jgi:ectoine hydroxylase-related dioxygenase (phytanoyl-CoA dioxygenase family)